jgi:16S rRNA (uracil1498-N3)-methyltransferase
MVEREHRPSVATFHAPGAWSGSVQLGEDAAHHAKVKRLQLGDSVRLTSGDGRRGEGVLEDLGKRALTITLDAASVTDTVAYPSIDLFVPVADRDRMLMLGEKAVELGVSSWQAVSFARSRSVTPRGEGDSFHQKLRARQIGALEQSGGAWLPELRPDLSFADFVAGTAGGASRFLLDADGERMSEVLTGLTPPVSIVLGPEGGLEENERASLITAGWRPVSIAANVLRFETAGIAALAILRSHLG